MSRRMKTRNAGELPEPATPVTEARDALLRRHPDLPRTDPTDTDAVERRAISAIATSDSVEAWRDVAIRWEDPAAEEDITDALLLCGAYRKRLDADERLLIDMTRRRGISWAEIALRLGLRDGRAAEERHHQLIAERVGEFRMRLLDPERTESAP
ncbi:hypothetical protein [Nonomuraea sp. NPDC023979]|uniref:hypothetical protein n=1 Tax=Nonomuraea sp. NPDC023979 TaxID=3154796 RepID=UPI0033CAB50F